MITLRETQRLDIQVLVDDVTDSLSSTPSFVTREWSTIQRLGMRLTTGASYLFRTVAAPIRSACSLV
jgi:7,8-dihydropterin-6-yl-methyl-4-(beta-D-ribofuranosyl)aminobenzene 5'-phosphate synthase